MSMTTDLLKATKLVSPSPPILHQFPVGTPGTLTADTSPTSNTDCDKKDKIDNKEIENSVALDLHKIVAECIARLNYFKQALDYYKSAPISEVKAFLKKFMFLNKTLNEDDCIFLLNEIINHNIKAYQSVIENINELSIDKAYFSLKVIIFTGLNPLSQKSQINLASPKKSNEIAFLKSILMKLKPYISEPLHEILLKGFLFTDTNTESFGLNHELFEKELDMTVKMVNSILRELPLTKSELDDFNSNTRPKLDKAQQQIYAEFQTFMRDRVVTSSTDEGRFDQVLSFKEMYIRSKILMKPFFIEIDRLKQHKKFIEALNRNIKNFQNISTKINRNYQYFCGIEVQIELNKLASELHNKIESQRYELEQINKCIIGLFQSIGQSRFNKIPDPSSFNKVFMDLSNVESQIERYDQVSKQMNENIAMFESSLIPNDKNQELEGNHEQSTKKKKKRNKKKAKSRDKILSPEKSHITSAEWKQQVESRRKEKEHEKKKGTEIQNESGKQKVQDVQNKFEKTGEHNTHQEQRFPIERLRIINLRIKMKVLTESELMNRESRVKTLNLTQNILDLFTDLYSFNFNSEKLNNLIVALKEKDVHISLDYPRGGSSHFTITIGNTIGYYEDEDDQQHQEDQKVKVELERGKAFTPHQNILKAQKNCKPYSQFITANIQAVFWRSGYTPEVLGIKAAKKFYFN